MNGPITVSRGEVAGIGKLKIPRTNECDHEIPMLSFIDIRESDGSFISTCINLRIDGYGKAIDDAEINMVENVFYFLRMNFSKMEADDAWDNLRGLFKSDDWSNELWDAYREVQIRLSMDGKATDSTAEIAFKLSELESRVKAWERRVRDAVLEKERTMFSDEIKDLAGDLIVKKVRLEKAA